MKEIFHRVSTRKFLPLEVEDDKITKILKAAMTSPSAKNGQPWEFYVIKNKQVLEELSNITPYSMCIKNAPAAIVVCYKKESIAPEFHDIDCAIATENILLEVDSLGLGAVMIGISPNEDKVKRVGETIKLDSSLSAFTIIPFGYPEKEKVQEDRFDERKIHYIN